MGREKTPVRNIGLSASRMKRNPLRMSLNSNIGRSGLEDAKNCLNVPKVARLDSFREVKEPTEFVLLPVYR